MQGMNLEDVFMDGGVIDKVTSHVAAVIDKHQKMYVKHAGGLEANVNHIFGELSKLKCRACGMPGHSSPQCWLPGALANWMLFTKFD